MRVPDLRRAQILAALAVLLAVVVATAPPAAGGDPGPPGAAETVPAYEAPANLSAPDEAATLLARRAAARVVAGGMPHETAAAARCLTGLGTAAVREIAAALRRAPWRGRAALVGALAEMDAPQVTPLLAAAARDPSFAVREAAVRGLGKTGDASCAGLLAACASPDAEPSWRVRAEAAHAIRRSVLRGVLERDAAGAALAALLGDPDPDVARAALAATAPLALEATLAPVLAAFGDRQRPSSDRAAALAALHAYRTPSDALLAALRRGFLSDADAPEAVRAGRALLDLRGAAALDDSEIASAAILHLGGDAAHEMREALVSLGPPAAPWLLAAIREARRRRALSSVEAGESAFEPLLSALLRLDEQAGIDVLRDTLAGPGAGSFHAETRLAALDKAETAYAARLGPELRRLLVSPEGRDIRGRVLRAVAASGGDDVGGFVEAALRDARPDVRSGALGVLEMFPRVPTPPALAELATGSKVPRERVRALECLSRRDPAAAARAAVSLLAHPDPAFRQAAIGVLAASRDAAHVDAIRQRLRDEDGRSSESSATADQPPPPDAATTGSDVAFTKASIRRRLRAALVGALSEAGGEAVRQDLLQIALGDDESRAREAALVALRQRVSAADADALARRLPDEPDEAARTEIRRLLALLGDAPGAVAVFVREMASPGTRGAALRLLAEERARVVPPGLAEGLADPDWTDEERSSALRILERAGRAPAPEGLARLARAARTPELLGEVVAVLAGHPSPDALSELMRLVAEEKDASRRAQVVRAAGERRAAETAPVLAALLDESRPAALAAAAGTDGAVKLYRETALALGRIGTPEAGRALVAQLLDPQLAALGAAHSVPANGPFQPETGAVVSTIRALVTAAAQIGDAELAALFGDALAQRAARGERFLLDEEYADGIARYLSDPMAYGLVPRRRTAAALPLWRLVAEGPPRLTPLDEDAWLRIAAELTEQRRFTDAAAARDAAVAAADVERAARPKEDRREEVAARAALLARAAAAAGRREEAIAIASGLRAADPACARLADVQGWCLVLVGGPPADALASIRDAVTLDTRRNARNLFHLAYATEAAEGAERALPRYDDALEADVRRHRELAQTEYRESRNGRQHRWGYIPYWQARALCAAGQDDRAAAALRDAILHDDRYGRQALTDAAFARFAPLRDVVDEALASLPDDPQR